MGGVRQFKPLRRAGECVLYADPVAAFGGDELGELALHGGPAGCAGTNSAGPCFPLKSQETLLRYE
jgi:hypothetical protein